MNAQDLLNTITDARFDNNWMMIESKGTFKAGTYQQKESLKKICESLKIKYLEGEQK